jgi:[ribosomal protein S18]-alanine N-acetyltransferase
LWKLVFSHRLQVRLDAAVQFTIRDYRPEDFQILLAIDQSCFEPGIAYSSFELKSYMKRRGSFTLVAASADKPDSAGSDRGGVRETSILGFIVAECTRGSGHIITIDVREEVRRYRVGSVLLESAEEQLKDSNCRDIRLETAVDNLSALSFYKRHGFSVVKTLPRYYSNGVDALLLEKDLLSTPSSS